MISSHEILTSQLCRTFARNTTFLLVSIVDNLSKPVRSTFKCLVGFSMAGALLFALVGQVF